MKYLTKPITFFSISIFSVFLSFTLADNDFYFDELNYGFGKVNQVYSSKSYISPSGKYHQTNKFKITNNIDTIPNVKGTTFGIKFKIKTKTPRVFTIKKRWTFPNQITNSQGQKFNYLERNQIIESNKELGTFYILEEDYEIISGNWKLEFFYKDSVIYSRDFFLK